MVVRTLRRVAEKFSVAVVRLNKAVAFFIVPLDNSSFHGIPYNHCGEIMAEVQAACYLLEKQPALCCLHYLVQICRQCIWCNESKLIHGAERFGLRFIDIGYQKDEIFGRNI